MDVTSAVEIDAARCSGCGACTRVCPLARFAGYTRITQVSLSECLVCGHCVAACPTAAVTAVRAGEPVSPLPATLPTEQILGVLRQRRSIRHFSPQAIDAAHWQVLLDALATAPSGVNARPVQATIVTDRATLGIISRKTQRMMALAGRCVALPWLRPLLPLLLGNAQAGRLRQILPELRALARPSTADDDPILHKAPAVLLLHASRHSPTGHDDCLLAAMSAMLVAPSIEVGTCLIGFATTAFQYDHSLQRLVDLPAGHTVAAVLAVGYPATPYYRLPSRPEVPVRWR